MISNNIPNPGQIVASRDWNGKTLMIRYPLPSDYEAARVYINTLSLERTYILMQGNQVSHAQEQAFIESALLQIRVGIGVQLFIFDGGRVCGSGGVTLKRFSEKHVGVLGISIGEAYRGEGVGSWFITLLMQEAKLRLIGISILTLEVFANNQRAIHLYTKMGFREYGRLPQGATYRDEKVDTILMHRPI